MPAPRLNDPENGTSQQPISSDQDGALIGELRQLGRIEDADRVQRCGLIPTPNGLVRCRLARRGCRSCAESEVRKRGRELANLRRRLVDPRSMTMGVWSRSTTDLKDTLDLLRRALVLLRRRRVAAEWTGGAGGLHIAWEDGRWFVHWHLYVEGAKPADEDAYRAAWADLTRERGTLTFRPSSDVDGEAGHPGRPPREERYLAGLDHVCPPPNQLPLLALDVLFTAQKGVQMVQSWGVTQRGKHMRRLSPAEWIARRHGSRKLYRARRGGQDLGYRRGLQVPLPEHWGAHLPATFVEETIQSVKNQVHTQANVWAVELLCHSFHKDLCLLRYGRLKDLLGLLAEQLGVYVTAWRGSTCQVRIGATAPATPDTTPRPRPRGSRPIRLGLDPLGDAHSPSTFEYVTMTIGEAMRFTRPMDVGRAMELMVACYRAERFADEHPPATSSRRSARDGLEAERRRILWSLSRVLGLRLHAVDVRTGEPVSLARSGRKPWRQRL